jgi:outer membrane receptor protein involved in Fe transport
MMKGRSIFLASCACFVAVPALAQGQVATPAPSETDGPSTDADESDRADIVVTGVARGQNRLDASVSVSSLGAEEIQRIAPRSIAEVFRNLPGIRSESSGGEGNANIAIRGLPVASGGAKFLQLQEDGLPVLEFGDITFGNADIFLRSDFNIGRVEAIRGGSASTFASNSPGGVINLISKTGETEGGSIQGTIGLDYEEYRLDFDYGAKLSETLRFHIGGFYRQGEGPRRAGYDANKGGQIKLNITKEFQGGYIRFFGKYLDDKAIGYLPNPVQVTGTARDPEYRDVPGFSINNDTLHSRYFTRNVTLDGNNNLVSRDIRNGQNPVVKSFGLETEFDLGGGWTVTERFRYSDISGGFTSNFPAAVNTAAATATALGGPGATVAFANGPRAGQAFGNGLLAQIVVFDVDLNSLDNVTNDIRISRAFDTGAGNVVATAGFYKSRQTVDTDWLWTAALLEVRGGGDAALVNVRNAAGQLVTQDGFYGYSARYFGNCCRRSYDVEYSTNAPFGSLSFETGRLTLDGSVRYDFGDAEGTVAGSDLGGGRVGVVARDINGDGVISAPEQQVGFIPLGSPSPVNYDYDYLSYSIGANLRISTNLAAFGRYSRGGRANADRLTFDPNNLDFTTGALRSSDLAVDFVNQAEAGVKYRSGGLALYFTGFYAETEEQNFEATTQRAFDRDYQAYGLELEGSFRAGPFSVSAGGTYTKAEITRDSDDASVEGNRPRRQAEFIYQLTPQYDTELFTIGANIVGTTDSYAQDNNELVLPGFTQVNAFLLVRPMERVQLSLNANNLFDVRGFTEAEEGAIPANGIVRARSINGRTVSASLRFDF